MKYNELLLGRQKTGRRDGRGISAGRGKTAGRGTKGQGSRKSSVKQGFEGGQMPLYMRLPKLRGFNSHRPAAESVYTGQLNSIKKVGIDTHALHEAGLISSPHANVKLLLKGELTGKKDVKLPAASQNAVKAIEKAGGSFSKTARLPRTGKPKVEKQ